MLNVADSGPYWLGVKSTLMLQLMPGETVAGSDPQVLVCEKSPLFAPLKVMPLMVKSSPPELLKVVVWGLPFAPIAHCPRDRLVGLTAPTAANGT